MAIQHPSARTITVEEYRELLAERLGADDVVGQDAAEHAELVFNLSRLHYRLSRDFEGLHRRRGWTWAGFRIMNVLWAIGAAELRDVARLSGASRAAVSSALNTLERDGLVHRVRDGADRRLVRIQLTQEGSGALREAMREQGDRERAWLSELAPSDQQRLSRLLGALADRQAPPKP
ncbi:MarR family transcriptional regulator [Mycobacterium florentinum]|uniref:MarR family transcriptional regulator n=1 Tax=Mycobacterium florentinum TaxID=292462 RepID=A0A1X1UCP7_MYCFL|nr:MarR family transcriptional regulator [Mycobacterium florentinum]MCV7412586.1 MarR family transcriptional regulator [Mycobacterium florentinum]ORV54556.1 MarR family transcriptional regulator [Mycobacterium florentinum]BBX81969.1 MarR family transcriptional regulator [Mycobacterium florentinum]